MRIKILYPVINGEISGGNMICFRIISEALKKGYEVVVNSPTEGRFTALLRERGIKIYNIDTGRTFRLDSVIKLSYAVKEEGINLIHSHTPLGGTIISRLAGWIAGIPVINHTHLSYYYNFNRIIRCSQFLLNWFTGAFCCVKVIAVSEFVKREIIKQGTPINKIIVVYNGIDPDNISYENNSIKIREEFKLKHNQYIIGQVGRFGEDKGQHILIKAAQKVIEAYPNVVFMIVGEDHRRNKGYSKGLEKLVSDLGLKQNIIFTGYRADIMDLMSTFDIFVLPTTFMEGLPMVILEAMAVKKPVIATSVGGNSEIVADGQTGTLIPPQDPDKLAKTIIYHLENPEISKKMGEEGYENLRQHFSLSQMLEKIFLLYNSVLNFN